MPVELCTVKNNNKWLYHNFAPFHKILLGLSSFVCEFFLRFLYVAHFFVCVHVALPSFASVGGTRGVERKYMASHNESHKNLSKHKSAPEGL